MKSTSIPMLVLAAMLACAGSNAIAAVYRWVDDNGTVHYGETPPDGVEATLVDTSSPQVGTVEVQAPPRAAETAESTTEPEPLSIAEQRRQERAERRAANAAEQQKIEAKCEAMRQQLAWAEPRPRVIIQTPEGPKRMDDDERLALVEEAKRYIAENCD